MNSSNPLFKELEAHLSLVSMSEVERDRILRVVQDLKFQFEAKDREIDFLNNTVDTMRHISCGIVFDRNSFKRELNSVKQELSSVKNGLY